MQFDDTRIAVRERDMFEILDLSLHVLRIHARPLILAFLIGMAPLALANHALIGWMADLDYREDMAGKWRFTWSMMVLVFLQAPFATIFVTAYLGAAVFHAQPTLREAIDSVRASWKRLAFVLLIMRGILPAMAIWLIVPRGSEFNPGLEVVLPAMICFFVGILRAVRPFTGEIVLLEKKPLFRSAESQVTLGERSKWLHGGGGDLIGRWLGSALVGVLLLLTFAYNFLWLWGTLLNDWSWGPFLLQVCVPLSMWMVVLYFGVVRFLCYLDQRIRYEGWEVELRLRAEAKRLAEHLT